VRGQREGELRPDVSPIWLTEALYSLVAGAGWVIQCGPGCATPLHCVVMSSAA
jgi:hypothetical protein